MTITLSRQLTNIVKTHYDAYGVYHDRNKDHIRHKFMQNGYFHTSKEYANMKRNILKDLYAAGIVFIDADWWIGDRPGYGPYKAFVIRTALPERIKSKNI
jgi:hypothetical protein